MSNLDTGEPAFPHTPSRTEPVGNGEWQLVTPGDHPGMSLRDYFAAKAIEGCCANQIDSSREGKDYTASHAYLMADAMLRARAR